MKIQDACSGNSAKVDYEGAFLLEGLENWIEQLTPIEGSVLFQDPKTKVKYAIKKINKD